MCYFFKCCSILSIFYVPEYIRNGAALCRKKSVKPLFKLNNNKEILNL